MLLRLGLTFVLGVSAASAFGQISPSNSKSVADSVPAQAEVIPERTLKFSPVDSDPTIALSAVTGLPQCDAGGYLFLDMLDPNDLSKHTVISFRGRQSQSYSPSAISDLHDIVVFGFFPSQSRVGFLVRATKDQPGIPGPGKSPAGMAWSSYHNFIAQFDRDGNYKGSVEVPVSFQLSHLAIFPSGELLVSGYDKVNSAARLLLLSASGQILKTIELPGPKVTVPADAPYGSVDAAKAIRTLMGSFVFTLYDEDILIWRTNSNDPIMDVNSGGSVREVPLETPPGYILVDMVPSNDRWVGHFRSEKALENSPFTSATYAYFEMRPQDASVSSKLVISGDVPQHLACESDGSYVIYKVGKDNKLILMKSN